MSIELFLSKSVQTIEELTNYSKFQSIEEVASKCDITIADRTTFVEEIKLEILEAFLAGKRYI